MEWGDHQLDLVLACANRVAGTSLRLPPNGDLALEAFGFDSLSAFAFILELEAVCGFEFDETLLDLGEVRTIRSMAAVVSQRTPSGSAADRPDDAAKLA